MELKKGTVVLSLAGRDKGKLLMVISTNEKTVFLVDGKERPLDNPKGKNLKHIKEFGCELNFDEARSNKALKKALKKLDGENHS